MKTRDKVNKLVYELRDRGILNLDCNVIGAGWNSDKHDNFVLELLTLRRLANKHHKLAEMEGNGEGRIGGIHYYNGTIDDYARRTYGHGVKSAYMPDDPEERTIFDKESSKIETKIRAICDRLGLRVEFQGDPRGYTVKFYKGDRVLDIQG